MIKAEIIADSINKTARITTFVLTYPRFIHAEIMTHRALSRNASSSRAIPVKKIIEQVKNDPAMPVWWGKNQAGMQARESLCDLDIEFAKSLWLDARDQAVEKAEALVELGLHKQIANRILEPWHHITVVATATEWANFFTLRCHPDAQPEFQELANVMARKYQETTPIQRASDDPRSWHLPFVDEDEVAKIGVSDAIKCSVARCARVSYLNHDGTKADIAKDIDLHDKLVIQKPAHASPSEHQAMPMKFESDAQKYSSNFKGWIQYRKLIPELHRIEENATTFPWEAEK